MLCQRIICVFLTAVGIATHAAIDVRIVSQKPASVNLFDGDVIKLSCEAETRNITWRDEKPNVQYGPQYTNSSHTIITYSTKGNKTTSTLQTSSFPKTKFFYIYCFAHDEKTGESGKTNFFYKYVKNSSIPRFQVQVPRTQAVAEGTRRHTLTCRVSSSMDVSSVTIKWLYNNETLMEKTVDLKTKKADELSVLLQCLTLKGLGDYTCLASTSLYDKVWHESQVTVLTGEHLGNTGISPIPALACHLVVFIGLLRNMV